MSTDKNPKQTVRHTTTQPPQHAASRPPQRAASRPPQRTTSQPPQRTTSQPPQRAISQQVPQRNVLPKSHQADVKQSFDFTSVLDRCIELAMNVLNRCIELAMGVMNSIFSFILSWFPDQRSASQPPQRTTSQPPQHAASRPPQRATTQPPQHAVSRPPQRVTSQPPQHAASRSPQRVTSQPPQHAASRPPQRVTSQPPQHAVSRPPQRAASRQSLRRNVSPRPQHTVAKQPIDFTSLLVRYIGPVLGVLGLILAFSLSWFPEGIASLIVAVAGVYFSYKEYKKAFTSYVPTSGLFISIVAITIIVLAMTTIGFAYKHAFYRCDNLLDAISNLSQANNVLNNVFHF